MVDEYSNYGWDTTHLWVWRTKGEEAEKIVSINDDNEQDVKTYYSNIDEG